MRQAVDLAERTASVQLESVVLSMSAGRPGSELIAAVRRRRGPDGHRRRHRPRARRRQPAFGARRAAPCCIRCRSAMRSTTSRGMRDPRGMLARAFRRRHACGDRRCRGGAQPDAGGRALPSRRRGDGGEPLCRRASRCSPTTRPISAPRSSTWAPAPPRWRCSPAAASSMPTASRSAATTSRWTSRAG